MEASVINSDLARWSRPNWFWAVLAVLALQLGVVWLSRPVQERLSYPAEPAIGLASEGSDSASGEWLSLEDPMLFASPGWHGVSALAWMNKPEFTMDVSRDFPPIRYLGYGEAGRMFDAAFSGQAEGLAAHRRPGAEATLPVLPPPRPEPVSRFGFAGFSNRRPVAVPMLPIQRHSDLVGRTEVQAAVDPDGFVVSARVVTPSGSKQADADALALSRGLRFEPRIGIGERPGEIAWGKLIFEWHALDLSLTNAVRLP